MLNDFGIEENNDWVPDAGVAYADWSNPASFATGPSVDVAPAVEVAAVRGFVLDPTIDYSIYVPADPLPAYVPPAFTPVIDYTQPEPITWAPTPTYTPPALITPAVPDFSSPTPFGGDAGYVNSPANWTSGGNDQPVSFAGFETVYDDNGADTGSFIYTGVQDPGAPPIGPAAQAAYDTGAAAGAALGAGAAIVTGIGAAFGFGLPVGIGSALGANAFSDNVKQTAQDWQYEGALQGVNNGIGGTNSNLDMFDNPPSNVDPFNRLTPTFQWNGSDAGSLFDMPTYGALPSYNNNDFGSVGNYGISTSPYSQPVYTMPDYMSGQGALLSYGDNYGTPALTGGSGTDFMFGNDGFGFDTFNFAV